jgi:hypothetical protein
MKNELLELIEKEPMARREFIDIHNSLPMWAKIVYHFRIFTGL